MVETLTNNSQQQTIEALFKKINMVCSLVVDLDHFVEIQLQLLIVYHIRILAIIWFFSLQFYAKNAKKSNFIQWIISCCYMEP